MSKFYLQYSPEAINIRDKTIEDGTDDLVATVTPEDFCSVIKDRLYPLAVVEMAKAKDDRPIGKAPFNARTTFEAGMAARPATETPVETTAQTSGGVDLDGLRSAVINALSEILNRSVLRFDERTEIIVREVAEWMLSQPAVQPATEQADTFPPRDFNADDEQCPRCSECPGSSHHWLDCFDDDEDDINSPHSHACKHCSAVGNECDECDGEGCEACDGEGVVRDLSVPAKVYRRPALNQPATEQAGKHGEAVTCPKGFRLDGRYPLLCEDYYGLDDNTYTVELSKAGRRATVTDGDETIHLLWIAGFSERQIQDAARYQIANIADMAGLVATVKAKPQTP